MSDFGITATLRSPDAIISATSDCPFILSTILENDPINLPISSFVLLCIFTSISPNASLSAASDNNFIGVLIILLKKIPNRIAIITAPTMIIIIVFTAVLTFSVFVSDFPLASSTFFCTTFSIIA